MSWILLRVEEPLSHVSLPKVTISTRMVRPSGNLTSGLVTAGCWGINTMTQDMPTKKIMNRVKPIRCFRESLGRA
ncbi:MAG: hypothetical protein CMO80_20290 [Verrucomicrobiales bacterium]|nr:hypothetical protein [Verrucomicrobiales bacterium]